MVAGNNSVGRLGTGSIHSIEIELKPGEQKDLVFILGYVENNLKNGVKGRNQ